MYHTDKSGNILNSNMRQIFGDCELGSVKFPAFDEGSGKIYNNRFIVSILMIRKLYK